MDILSKDVLTLLQDENLRKAVDELLTKAAGASSSVTVIIPESDADASTNEPKSKQVILRRLVA
jgi:hypothetical protein